MKRELAHNKKLSNSTYRSNVASENEASKNTKKAHKLTKNEKPDRINIKELANRILVSDENGNIVTPIYRKHGKIIDRYLEDMLMVSCGGLDYRKGNIYIKRHLLENMRIGQMYHSAQVELIHDLREAGMIVMVYNLKYIINMLCMKKKNIPLEFLAWYQLFGEYAVMLAIDNHIEKCGDKNPWSLFSDLLLAKSDKEISNFIKNNKTMHFNGSKYRGEVSLTRTDSLVTSLGINIDKTDECVTTKDGDGDDISVVYYSECAEDMSFTFGRNSIPIYSENDFKRLKRIIKDTILTNYTGEELTEYDGNQYKHTKDIPSYDSLLETLGETDIVREGRYDDEY